MGLTESQRRVVGELPRGIPDCLTGLVKGARRQLYGKGALIIEERDAGATMFVLLTGRVKAFSTDDDGRQITFGIYDAGDYFGEMALDGGVRSASVMALEPCECAVIELSELAACIQRDPTFALELLNRVIARARAATAAARSMALNSAYERLFNLFGEMSGTRLDEGLVEFSDVSHQDIASRIGASREMVSRLLKDLERGGYVRTSTRKVVLLKRLPAKW